MKRMKQTIAPSRSGRGKSKLEPHFSYKKCFQQEPHLCSAEKPRRSQSSLCVFITDRILTIGFNAPQNANLASAFFFISPFTVPPPFFSPASVTGKWSFRGKIARGSGGRGKNTLFVAAAQAACHIVSKPQTACSAL